MSQLLYDPCMNCSYYEPVSNTCYKPGENHATLLQDPLTMRYILNCPDFIFKLEVKENGHD